MLGFFKVTAVKESVVGLDTVICPFPNESAHHLFVVIDHIPIRRNITARVTHCVSVLAKHKWAGFLGIVENVSANLFKGRIHHTDHIDKLGIVVFGICVLQALVVNRPCLVTIFNVICALEKCFAEGALVSERPNDYARAVLISFNKCRVSVGNAGCKEIVLRILFPKRNIIATVTGTSTVHFKICFIHYIDAKFVAKQIEFGTVGIVRGSDCVDVQLLHQVDVLRHILKAYGRGGLAIKVMSVYAFEFHGIAVDLEHLSVDAYFAESDAFFNLFTVCMDFKRIKIRLLCRPMLCSRMNDFSLHTGRNDDAAIFENKLYIHFALICKREYAVAARQFRFNLIIGYMLFGTGEQIYVSVNAREAELILTFEIGGNAPLENQNVDGVLSV